MQYHRSTEKYLHDPPALDAKLGQSYELTFIVSNAHLDDDYTGDWNSMIRSIPKSIHFILPQSTPYILDALLFSAFVYWNKGIVLGAS